MGTLSSGATMCCTSARRRDGPSEQVRSARAEIVLGQLGYTHTGRIRRPPNQCRLPRRTPPRMGEWKEDKGLSGRPSWRSGHQIPLTIGINMTCLLYTSDAADEEDSVDLGGRRIIKKKKKKSVVDVKLVNTTECIHI
eukprot:TRINITY_DN724_c0_g1_i10.p1 TRINITY_DN724_c0_g1~~TRINITY_DN724_c0_g1_i10.p1  ORF type:complete len:138 (+),score=10.87 TRINITY_DN724_c0_g1_i10:372-785(+)